MLVFGFFLTPIAEHDFTVQAAKRLFIAKTSDKDFFLEPNFQEEGGVEPNKFLPKEDDETAAEKGFQDHRHIRLSKCDDFSLFLVSVFWPCFCNCCWTKKEKL